MQQGVPGAMDIANFTNANNNASTIDAHFAGTVMAINLGGYTGTITLARSLTVTTYTQSSGTIDGAYSITIGGVNSHWSGGTMKGNGNPATSTFVVPAATNFAITNNVNLNGTRQATELANENVPVYLFTSTDDYYDSTLTDADGNYEFVNLDPGDYYVAFGRLSAKTWTSKDQGGDDMTDSDANAVNGQTAVFTVDFGVDVTSLDVGLVDNTNNHAPQGTDATIAL